MSHKQEFIVLDDNETSNKIQKTSLNEALNHINESFQQTLFSYIDQKQLDEVEVYNKSHVDRRLFSKIRSDVNFKPSRKTAISLCFGLELTLEETLDLLEKAGYVLSHSSKADVIIEYFIDQNKYDLGMLNEVLYDYGEVTLYE